MIFVYFTQFCFSILCSFNKKPPLALNVGDGLFDFPALLLGPMDVFKIQRSCAVDFHALQAFAMRPDCQRLIQRRLRANLVQLVGKLFDDFLPGGVVQRDQRPINQFVHLRMIQSSGIRGVDGGAVINAPAIAHGVVGGETADGSSIVALIRSGKVGGQVHTLDLRVDANLFQIGLDHLGGPLFGVV